MTEEQYYYLMAGIGFGFGVVFFSFFLYLVFAWKGKA